MTLVPVPRCFLPSYPTYNPSTFNTAPPPTNELAKTLNKNCFVGGTMLPVSASASILFPCNLMLAASTTKSPPVTYSRSPFDSTTTLFPDIRTFPVLSAVIDMFPRLACTKIFSVLSPERSPATISIDSSLLNNAFPDSVKSIEVFSCLSDTVYNPEPTSKVIDERPVVS